MVDWDVLRERSKEGILEIDDALALIEFAQQQFERWKVGYCEDWCPWCHWRGSHVEFCPIARLADSSND